MNDLFRTAREYIISSIGNYVASSYEYSPDSQEHQEAIAYFDQCREKGKEDISKKKLLKIGKKLYRTTLDWEAVNERCLCLAQEVLKKYNWKIVKKEICLGEHWGWTKQGHLFNPYLRKSHPCYSLFQELHKEGLDPEYRKILSEKIRNVPKHEEEKWLKIEQFAILRNWKDQGGSFFVGRLIQKNKVLVTNSPTYIKIQQCYRYIRLRQELYHQGCKGIGGWFSDVNPYHFHYDPKKHMTFSTSWESKKEYEKMLSKILQLTGPYYEKHANWLPYPAFAALIIEVLKNHVSSSRCHDNKLEEIPDNDVKRIISTLDFFHTHQFFIESIGKKLNKITVLTLPLIKLSGESYNWSQRECPYDDTTAFLRFCLKHNIWAIPPEKLDKLSICLPYSLIKKFHLSQLEKAREKILILTKGYFNSLSTQLLNSFTNLLESKEVKKDCFYYKNYLSHHKFLFYVLRFDQEIKNLFKPYKFSGIALVDYEGFIKNLIDLYLKKRQVNENAVMNVFGNILSNFHSLSLEKRLPAEVLMEILQDVYKDLKVLRSYLEQAKSYYNEFPKESTYAMVNILAKDPFQRTEIPQAIKQLQQDYEQWKQEDILNKIIARCKVFEKRTAEFIKVFLRRSLDEQKILSGAKPIEGSPFLNLPLQKQVTSLVPLLSEKYQFDQEFISNFIDISNINTQLIEERIQYLEILWNWTFALEKKTLNQKELAIPYVQELGFPYLMANACHAGNLYPSDDFQSLYRFYKSVVASQEDFSPITIAKATQLFIEGEGNFQLAVKKLGWSFNIYVKQTESENLLLALCHKVSDDDSVKKNTPIENLRPNILCQKEEKTGQSSLIPEENASQIDRNKQNKQLVQTSSLFHSINLISGLKIFTGVGMSGVGYCTKAIYSNQIKVLPGVTAIGATTAATAVFLIIVFKIENQLKEQENTIAGLKRQITEK